jgi:hypothetical protein
MVCLTGDLSRCRPTFGTIITFVLSFVITEIGYDAKAKLIKKKYLVYN